MENGFDQDLMGKLPQSMIEIILTKLPIRDAVRTSILSREWRFKWASLTQLVFNDRCATHDNDRSIVEANLFNFMTRFLFLCNGPIHKFSLSTSYLQGAPDVDQWLLLISWTEIKELILELGELTVRAPKLKYLILEGVKDISLSNTPNLAAISVAMTEVSAEHFERISSCNFNNFLGGVPVFQRLIGHIYFTKYLGIGNGRGWIPFTYHQLNFIKLYQVSLVDDKDLYVVLQLIENSPNLLELQISGSSTSLAATRDPDLDFWDRNSSSDCMFHQLKTVKMTDIFGVPRELNFIKYLLEHSPCLEIMTIIPSLCEPERKLNMLIDMLNFGRASPRASVIFDPDEA